MPVILGLQRDVLGNLPFSSFGFCKEDLLVVHLLHLPTLIRDLNGCLVESLREREALGEGGVGKYPQCFPCILVDPIN